MMEVLSDHADAFDLMFYFIRYIMTKSESMRPTPQRSLFKFVSDEDEEEDDEEIFLQSTYTPEKYETERLNKKILKVGDLLNDKIRFQ